jgi:hypothetical protein
MGLAQGVRIVCNVDPPLKRLLYGAADVFVSPADNLQETFGLTLVEAMASGLPVVASNWSGYRDLVADGTTGYLVNTFMAPQALGYLDLVGHLSVDGYAERALAQHTVVDVEHLQECMLRLAASPTLRSDMGAAGRSRAQSRFVWSRVIPQFASLWDEQLRAAPDAAKLQRLSFAAAFRHYAATTDLESLCVTCSESALAEVSSIYRSMDVAVQLAQACLRAPQPRRFLKFPGMRYPSK